MRETTRRGFLKKLAKYGTGAACAGAMISVTACDDIFSNKIYTVDVAKCNGCSDCLNACNFGAITIQNAKALISESKCAGCGKCPGYCDQGAISSV